MSGEIAAGDIATGMLVGRAVEPSAGEAHGSHGGLCLNCGTRLIGAHCHTCGQSGHVHRTAGAIGHEIAHGVFHFEGKIWRTLPMLALRPGELTRRYVAGERARFVSPMAIFLFSVFLLFAVVASLPGWQFDGSEAFGGGSMEEAGAKLAEERLDAAADVARHARRLQRLRAEPADAEAIAKEEARLAEARRAEAGIAAAQRFLPHRTLDRAGRLPRVRSTAPSAKARSSSQGMRRSRLETAREESRTRPPSASTFPTRRSAGFNRNTRTPGRTPSSSSTRSRPPPINTAGR